jgi:hypothetical protein
MLRVEQERQLAEKERQLAEQERRVAEQLRVDAEAIRQANEEERVRTEVQRRLCEERRCWEWQQEKFRIHRSLVDFRAWVDSHHVLDVSCLQIHKTFLSYLPPDPQNLPELLASPKHFSKYHEWW